jgi:hypothetical protein
MKYAHIDPDGYPIAFYSLDIHRPDQIPSECIEITDEVWQECLENQGERKIDLVTKCAIPCEPKPQPVEQLLHYIRLKRNTLLAETDWTQLPDVNLTSEQQIQFHKYRQELRDFPTTCDPYNPIWPEKP